MDISPYIDSMCVKVLKTQHDTLDGNGSEKSPLLKTVVTLSYETVNHMLEQRTISLGTC